MPNYKDLCPDDVDDPADYSWDDLGAIRAVVVCAYPGCSEAEFSAECSGCGAPLCRTHETAGVCQDCRSNPSDEEDFTAVECEIPF